MRDVLVQTLLSSTWRNSDDIKPLIVGKTLQIALDFCVAAIFDLKLAGYSMNSKYITRPKYSHISLLKTLHESGGWMGLQEYLISIFRNYRSVYLQYLPPGIERKSLEQELDHLEHKLASIQRRVQDTIDFVRQEHEAVVTQNFERLTKISFVFVPITSVATILSINEPRRYAWFFLITVPLLVICLYSGNLSGLLREFGLLWSNKSKKKDDRSNDAGTEESNIGTTSKSQPLSKSE
jgi:hypothetical protein